METMEGTSSAQNNKIRQAQARVDEVVGVMQVNIAKVLERDHKLSELDDRADALNVGAFQFEQQAMKLKRKMWWKNLKFTLILGAIVGVLVLILIIWIARSFGDDKHPVTEAPSS
ncbi:synaptobrevin-1-like [Cimex lectularius]|uniref:V-SNARE coiled-coil homology domain-containing protein n=1 Tax=Cimex lectularius TaxID=79782 RepID=A0A8I6R828_CIMLE|nr:synaptobrevin-1-like [Cimex lectularius]XP_014239402.1 synaptobrevin-1-like [Cimex lectularius]XP_014239403.1 synaptobrevin-1-like [Cimex lectularius]